MSTDEPTPFERIGRWGRGPRYKLVAGCVTIPAALSGAFVLLGASVGLSPWFLLGVLFMLVFFVGGLIDVIRYRHAFRDQSPKYQQKRAV